MAGKISIASQVLEAERELRMRHKAYPNQVRCRSLRQEEADMLLARQEAIIATLRWAQDNEADIRAWQAERKAGGTA